MISDQFKLKIICYYFERLKYALDNKLSKSGRESYSLEFNSRTSSIGLCHYKKKTIFLSEYHMQYATWDAITQTINHELAHWAAPAGSRHGTAWQEMARKFGIEPNRCSSHAKYEYPWLIMFGDEIVGKSIVKDHDIGEQYILRRKKETIGKLFYLPNPNMIDNSKFVE